MVAGEEGALEAFGVIFSEMVREGKRDGLETGGWISIM